MIYEKERMKDIHRIIRRLLFPLAALTVVAVTGGCKVRYSFSGASIDSSIQTASVAYFPNMAAMVSTLLSPALYDGLTDKIQRETRLRLVREDGDVSFEGEITDYRSSPFSISGAEYAMQNRLTIVVKVRYTNTKQPNLSFDRSFSAYADYDTNTPLATAESSLIPEIVEKLAEDIFNAAFSNW